MRTIRNKKKETANEVLNILQNKKYMLGDVEISMEKELEYCVSNTVYYTDAPVIKFEAPRNTVVTFVNATTTDAALRLLNDGLSNLVALNFASAHTPGGGWLHGATGQEEDLARRSGLYASIRQKTMYYNNNILNNTPYYTDGIIYSPKVPFFKNENLQNITPYELSIITSPAPNIAKVTNPDEHFISEILTQRAIKILKIAAFHDHKNIILGAWGCGAFQNQPRLVADAFLTATKMVPFFENVCFAVYDNYSGEPILNEFIQTFAPSQ